MGDDEREPRIRVGDLAAAAGLTVRAIHHYEQIGLLPQAGRSESGHRLFGPDAVERLYRIGRLRRLGLPLDQIRRVLHDPEHDLADALQRHASGLDDEVARLSQLRSNVAAVLADLDRGLDPTTDLLEVLKVMDDDSLLRRRISILVYRDVAAAHAYLVDVFGLTPGEVTVDDEGRTVHAEVHGGDGVIWLHPETAEFRLASPATLGAATATMAVMVDDVDAHHDLVRAKGGEVVYPPVDQPYGYREYSVRDCEGTLWSFMKELES